MPELAGIYNVSLYENRNLVVSFTDKETINSITTDGQILNIENCQGIKFEFTPERNFNNKVRYNYNLEYILYDLTKSNIDIIKTIKKSIYGWIPFITFYNSKTKILLTPFTFNESNINNNLSNTYNITLKNNVLAGSFIDYNEITQGIGYMEVENTFIVA